MLAEAAMTSEMLGQPREMQRLAERAFALGAESEGRLALTTALVLGMARILRGEAATGYPLLRHARPLLESSEPSILRLTATELLFGELYVGNYDEGGRLLADLVARIREQGALSALPYALVGLSFAEFFLGDWRVAYALAGAVAPWAQDLTEAYLRMGRVREAEATLEVLERQARQTGRALAHAAAERCRGLLAADKQVEANFQRALTWHDRVACPFERARTELCFGERLRRARRRSDAREPLRRALAGFEALAAAPWLDRTSAELRATGERARRRTPETADRLTPQELQVAQLIAGGATNREAAAALFVTPKTIESHLGHVYRKLGVRSRVELARQGLS
jgi:DNA-binding CsgD family transcriptional regulator